MANKNTKAYENKLEYISQYTKQNYRFRNITFALNNNEDVRLLNHLDAQENKSAYIKNLILKDIEEK